MLTSRKKPRKSKIALPFAFTGFAKCGECGCAITAQYATNRFGTRYTYYRCTKKSRATTRCEQPYIREEGLDAEITALLKPFSLRADWADEMLKRVKDEKTQSSELKAP